MRGSRVFNRSRLLLPAIAIAACSFAIAEASRVRPMNLEEMAVRAGRIFRGTCTAVETARDPDSALDVARVTFRVERLVKGEAAESLTIRMLADPDGAGAASAGSRAAPFRPGERVVLFLYGESRSGLTSPVGLGQGKFTIVEDKDGREVALNGFDGEVLFRGLSPAASAKLGGWAARRRGREGISPDALLDMAEALAR